MHFHRAVFLLLILTAVYGLLVPQFLDIDISGVSPKQYTILSEDADILQLAKEFPKGRVLSDIDGGRVLVHDMTNLLARLTPREQRI